MTVLWDVEEWPHELRLAGELTLIVWSPNAQHEYLAIQTLVDQREVWTARTHVTHTYDGRRANIRFVISVRSANSAEEQVLSTSLRDGLPSAEHGGTLCGAPEVQRGLMAVQSWVRTLPGAPNIVLAGTPPPPEGHSNSAAVIANSVMLYAEDQLNADSEYAGFFGGAHEIGHLIGLDDLYGSTPAARWCGAVGSRCAGNIMRETDQHRARYDARTGQIRHYAARRPWVGRMLLRDVAEAALFAGRSTRTHLPQQSEHQLMFLAERRGSDNTHRVRRYTDQRPAPRRSVAGCSCAW